MDKAPTYPNVIDAENRRYDPQADPITHVDRNSRNDRIESDNDAFKRLLGYRQSLRSRRSAKSTLRGIEAIRTIEKNHIDDMKPSVSGEIALVNEMFGLAA